MKIDLEKVGSTYFIKDTETEHVQKVTVLVYEQIMDSIGLSPKFKIDTVEDMISATNKIKTSLKSHTESTWSIYWCTSMQELQNPQSLVANCVSGGYDTMIIAIDIKDYMNSPMVSFLKAGS